MQVDGAILEEFAIMELEGEYRKGTKGINEGKHSRSTVLEQLIRCITATLKVQPKASKKGIGDTGGMVVLHQSWKWWYNSWIYSET